jgi:hypothetical protein
MRSGSRLFYFFEKDFLGREMGAIRVGLRRVIHLVSKLVSKLVNIGFQFLSHAERRTPNAERRTPNAERHRHHTGADRKTLLRYRAFFARTQTIVDISCRPFSSPA